MPTEYCSKCKNNELPLSEVEGYEHLCLACEAQQMSEEMDELWDSELAILKERTGHALDFDAFCFNCTDLFSKENLEGLPELTKIYNEELAEAEQYKRGHQPPWPEGEDWSEDDDLPF